MTKTVRNAELGVRSAESKTKPFRIPKSALRAEASSNYLVGGVNSPVRAFRHVGAEPLIVERARGAEITGADGKRYIDFISGWGALILGHNPPAVTAAVRTALSRGELFGLTCPDEQALAEAIVRSTPSVERVRFTVSGTEACMTAVKLARAHTGRTKILAFTGGYHGHADSLMGGQSAGVPASAAGDLLHAAYNDHAACEQIFNEHGRDIACVIVEPIAANMGVVPAEAGFLEGLRRLATAVGAVLIFDEVVTGFRFTYGGLQNLAKVTPDLTVFGKIIGGGFPVGAVGGRAEIMSRLAPEGNVYHGGTFAGHPLTMAAGLATLRSLRTDPPYARLLRLGTRLVEGLCSAPFAGQHMMPQQTGSMATLFFADAPVRNHEDARRADRSRFALWANGLRQRGILVPPSPMEALFLTAAHTDRHVDRLLSATQDILTR